MKRLEMHTYVKRNIVKRVKDIAATVLSSGVCDGSEENGFFTRAELEYCAGRLRCLGARLMIKECVFDYLASESSPVVRNYREIEITNDEFRKPTLRLRCGPKECADRLRIKDILITISHSRAWIAGMVLFCY